MNSPLILQTLLSSHIQNSWEMHLLTCTLPKIHATDLLQIKFVVCNQNLAQCISFSLLQSTLYLVLTDEEITLFFLSWLWKSLLSLQWSKTGNWPVPKIQHESLVYADVSKGILTSLFSYREIYCFADTKNVNYKKKTYMISSSAIGTMFVAQNKYQVLSAGFVTA